MEECDENERKEFEEEHDEEEREFVEERAVQELDEEEFPEEHDEEREFVEGHYEGRGFVEEHDEEEEFAEGHNEERAFAEGHDEGREFVEHDEVEEFAEEHDEEREFVEGHDEEGESTEKTYKSYGEEMLVDNDSSAEMTSAVKFKCLICGRYFMTQEDFNEHNKSHSKESRYKCMICEFTSKDSASVLRHVRRKHPTILLKFRCKDCDEEFFSKKLLQRHRKEKHAGNYKCSFCDHVFDKKKRLTEHQKLRHSENYEKPFKCLKCERSFVYPHLLKRHEDRYKGECYVEGHADGQPYACEICKKTYVELDSYRKHHQLHVECDFECTICHAPLVSLESLKMHMARHREEEKQTLYKCEFCEKTYTKVPSLNYHLVHTHKKPTICICNVCGERFPNRKELFSHRRYHFECIVCGKQFRNDDELLKHKKRVCIKNELSPERPEVPVAYDQLFNPPKKRKKTIIRVPKIPKVDEEEDDDSLDKLLFREKLGCSSSSNMGCDLDIPCEVNEDDISDTEIIGDLKELEDSVNAKYFFEFQDSENYDSEISN